MRNDIIRPFALLSGSKKSRFFSFKGAVSQLFFMSNITALNKNF